ncbi:minor pilin subunit [Escherichia coli]|nr:minor pilin subunit [Escherichia coli]
MLLTMHQHYLLALLPKTITPATLIQKGYLKSGFSESNFGQSYITGIAKNSKTSRLEALTCSNGGQSLSEAGMRSVASMIEGLGGYINSSKAGDWRGVAAGLTRLQTMG